MNSFYASVETMLRPELRGKAIAVCGSTEDRHGIVLAKSDAAKKCGIKTGMVAWQARQLCPQLICVPPQYDQYLKYSRLAHRIYERYTDLVEPFGMDECWLDVTASKVLGDGTAIAQEIRRSVREELGLTVSIGVSFTKIFAKLGSDMKKPDAVTVIPRAQFRDIVWPLDASEMIYVGPATRRKLADYGIHTIGELAVTSPEYLRRWFGINGLKLWRYANGTDTGRVAHRDFVSPMKSLGHGVTCIADLLTPEEVYRVILDLSQDVSHRLRLHHLVAGGVQLFLRDKDLAFSSLECSLPLRTRLPHELTAAGFRLFQENYSWEKPVRAVCIRATHLLPDDSPEQLSFFADTAIRDKKERLMDTCEDVRRRFGKKSLTFGILLGPSKIPEDGRDLGTVTK